MNDYTQNENNIQEWERIRSKGRKRFVWLRGVLCFGGLFSLICLFIYYYILLPGINSPTHFYVTTAITLAVIFYGLFQAHKIHAKLWRKMEENDQKINI